jgi:hypothetical protein
LVSQTPSSPTRFHFGQGFKIVNFQRTLSIRANKGLVDAIESFQRAVEAQTGGKYTVTA